MNSKNQTSIFLLILYIIVSLIFVFALFAIHKKLDVPISLLCSPMLSIVTAYILYSGWTKFTFRHKLILVWVALGFFIFFCYATYKFIQVGSFQYSVWHVIAVIFPLFFTGKIEYKNKKKENKT
jgi:hypothetical protein